MLAVLATSPMSEASGSTLLSVETVEGDEQKGTWGSRSFGLMKDVSNGKETRCRHRLSRWSCSAYVATN